MTSYSWLNLQMKNSTMPPSAMPPPLNTTANSTGIMNITQVEDSFVYVASAMPEMWLTVPFLSFIP
jgi:hypothetical protein